MQADIHGRASHGFQLSAVEHVAEFTEQVRPDLGDVIWRRVHWEGSCLDPWMANLVAAVSMPPVMISTTERHLVPCTREPWF